MELRHDMLTHGVNIVAAAHEGKVMGLAVAWATQIATNRILICVGKQSATRDLILESGAFGLSLLARQHLDIARSFGLQSSRNVDKFKDAPYHTYQTGSPLLDDCATWFDCRVEDVFDVEGDEKLIVGRIIGMESVMTEFKPLIYRQDDYE